MGIVIKIKSVTIHPSVEYQKKPEGLFVPAQLAETVGIPEIGQPWPEQGGIRAGYMPPEDGQPGYSIIVSTEDAAEDEAAEWGHQGTSVDGLSTRDGKANTETLVALTVHPAADFCAGLEMNGHADWYLPSRREASIMAGTVPHLFSAGWHWTSTQYSAIYAFSQDFADGCQYYHLKYNAHRVRAVRRVIH